MRRGGRYQIQTFDKNPPQKNPHEWHNNGSTLKVKLYTSVRVVVTREFANPNSVPTTGPYSSLVTRSGILEIRFGHPIFVLGPRWIHKLQNFPGPYSRFFIGSSQLKIS